MRRLSKPSRRISLRSEEHFFPPLHFLVIFQENLPGYSQSQNQAMKLVPRSPSGLVDAVESKEQRVGDDGLVRHLLPLRDREHLHPRCDEVIDVVLDHIHLAVRLQAPHAATKASDLEVSQDCEVSDSKHLVTKPNVDSRDPIQEFLFRGTLTTC
jgi:hypothetical protein